MSKKKSPTPEQRLEKYNFLSEKKAALENKLRRSQSTSAPRRAAELFRLPFGKNALAAMWEASSFLGLTFIFAGVGALVGVGILLCLIIDAVWAVIFWALYPITLLFVILLHPVRVAALKHRLAKAEKALSTLDLKEIQKAIKDKKEKEERERAERESTYHYIPISDAVKETDYYKNKVDEEYRRLMNLPPRDDSLPSYATDTSLDLHPGDY